MIPSGRLGINDHAERAAAFSRLSARLAEVNARRRAAEQAVDALGAAWRGSALDHQLDGWQEMDDAARDTIDSLSALLGALDLAREELADKAPPARRPSVAVPRQTDRRAHPWAPLTSDRLPPVEVSSRQVRRSGP